jgi:hypothetical protein
MCAIARSRGRDSFAWAGPYPEASTAFINVSVALTWVITSPSGAVSPSCMRFKRRNSTGSMRKWRATRSAWLSQANIACRWPGARI